MIIDANTVLAFDFEGVTAINNVPELTGSTGATWSWLGSQAQCVNAWPMRGDAALYQNRMTGAYSQQAQVAYTRAVVQAMRSDNWTVDFCITIPYYSAQTNAMLQAQSGVGSIAKLAQARFSGYAYCTLQLLNYGTDLYMSLSGPTNGTWTNVFTPFARHHVVLRRNDASTVELFVDGVSKGTRAMPQYHTTASEDHDFYIGCHNVNPWYGMLVLDDFRISNITRDDTWVAAQTSCETPAATPKLTNVDPQSGPEIRLTFDLPVTADPPTIGAASSGVGVTGVTQVDSTTIDLNLAVRPDTIDGDAAYNSFPPPVGEADVAGPPVPTGIGAEIV